MSDIYERLRIANRIYVWHDDGDQVRLSRWEPFTASQGAPEAPIEIRGLVLPAEPISLMDTLSVLLMVGWLPLLAFRASPFEQREDGWMELRVYGHVTLFDASHADLVEVARQG